MLPASVCDCCTHQEVLVHTDRACCFSCGDCVCIRYSGAVTMSDRRRSPQPASIFTVLRWNKAGALRRPLQVIQSGFATFRRSCGLLGGHSPSAYGGHLHTYRPKRLLRCTCRRSKRLNWIRACTPRGISAPALQAWARARTCDGFFGKLGGRPPFPRRLFSTYRRHGPSAAPPRPFPGVQAPSGSVCLQSAYPVI